MVILNLNFKFLEDKMPTNNTFNKTVKQALKEYVEFLETRYGVYYNNYLRNERLNMPSDASFWEGFKESTLATINDLKDILEGRK